MTDSNIALSAINAIFKRRSVRSYAPDRLSRDIIQTLLAAAVRAPTAIHEEQWAFAIVQGKSLLKHLSEQARALFVAELARTGTERHKHVLHNFNDPDFNIFYDADTLILICARSHGAFVEADCWLAAENLMLAACAMGLGSCVIGSAVPGLNTAQLKSELDIPEEMTVVAPIIVGVPKEEAPTTQRENPVIVSWKSDPP